MFVYLYIHIVIIYIYKYMYIYINLHGKIISFCTLPRTHMHTDINIRIHACTNTFIQKQTKCVYINVYSQSFQRRCKFPRCAS